MTTRKDTDAGALAVILDEAKNGPWKPDDDTSLWFYNEAGDQLHLSGDDVVLLLNAARSARSEPPGVRIHHGDPDDFCRQCPHARAAHDGLTALGHKCRNCECERFV